MILSIGELLLDLTIVPEGQLRTNDDSPATITIGGGGQAANFCAWAAALGEPVRLVTRMGDDELGHKLVADMQAFGVEVLPVWSPEPTGAVAVLVGPNGERTMATQRGASVGLRPEDLSERWFRGVRLIHVPAYSLFLEPLAAAARAAIAMVRKGGGRLSIDLSSAAGLKAYGGTRMAGELAQLKPELLFATVAESDALGVPLERLANVAVLKLGPAGCRVDGRDVPAPPVPEVDPTGAGDAFAAAFCATYLGGATPIEAAERAVLVAPGAVTRAGARPRGGVFTHDRTMLQVLPEVARALDADRPVVALETSIVGQGLPAPYNLRAARESEAAIREEGAVPATVAVLDGRLRIGLTDADLQRVAAGATKVSSRDLGPALARRAVGATTVAATMRAAAMTGIRFFATGGIGGVHRGHPEDQSADLVELGRTPVAVFCAGAKIILDLALTLERLESLSVPVLGYGCDELPAFYSRRSGCPVGVRVDGPEETAAVLRAAWETGARGIVIAVPPPGELEDVEDLVQRAVQELAGVAGPSLTPRLLARVAELSGGRSLDLNVELVVNNARVAARVASRFAADH